MAGEEGYTCAVGTYEVDDQAAVGAPTGGVAEEGHAVRELGDADVAGVGHRVPEAKQRVVALRGGGMEGGEEEKEEDGELHGWRGGTGEARVGSDDSSVSSHSESPLH